MLTAKIVSDSIPEYKTVKGTYKKSFPRFEQIPYGILLAYAKRKGSLFIAFYDEGVFCGETYLIHLGNTVFILYLAVNPELRSQGYGSKILSWVQQKFPNHKISLTIETVDESRKNYEERLKRREFYSKNGFTSTPYRVKEFGVVYDILSNNVDYSFEEYEKVSKYLSFNMVKEKAYNV